MTISTTDSKVIYTGSGITGPYTFTFPIYSASDLVVTRYTISSGATSTFVLNTDYTVSGSFTATNPASGSITLTTALSSSYKLIIQRSLAYTQSVDLQPADDLPADTIEKLIADRIVMLVQQLKETVDRGVVSDASNTSGFSLPIPSSLQYLRWNTGATGLENGTPSNTATNYGGSMAYGLDASKSATPTTGDVYYATDTSKLYVCFSSPTWKHYESLESGSVTTAKLAAGVASGLTTVTGVSSDHIVIADASDSGNVKKALASDFTFVPSASNALAGSVVQVQYQELVTSSTGTTTIPFDDTIPQNTEGDEYLSKAITPTNTNNILKIDVVVFCGSGSDDSKVVALFKDSDASAIAAGFHRMGINLGGGIKFSHFRTAGSTSAQTFKVRAGGQGGTFRINGADSSRRFGGVLVSSLCITEIKV